MVRLSPGFKIDRHEMDRLAKFFHSVSGEYGGALTKAIPIPRGGSVGIDRAMATTLKVINEMHTVLSKAIDQHYRKLAAASTNFLSAEEQNGNAAEQVQKLLNAGETVHDGERLVVAEYLGGARPAYLTPGPTQPTSIDGQQIGQGPDGDPALAKVPKETEIAPHRPWVPFQHQIISFDYRGLWQLTDELNAFIQKADPLVLHLAKRVAEFCSPYQNYGDTVYQFNATFSQDANLASGFHKIVSTISADIDGFAYAMAAKEAWLEEFAHRHKVPDVLLAMLTQRKSKEEIQGYLREAGTHTGANGNFHLFVEAAKTVLRQADDLRKQTANQLILQAEMITSGGLDYYTKKDVHLGSADPGGLFNDGTSPDPAITKQLEAELADDGRRLKDSPADVRAALGNLSKVGGYGGQIGAVMGGLEGVKKSETLFQTTKNVGNLSGVVGPVLETIGLLVFAE
jgi:hypothetical protein